MIILEKENTHESWLFSKLAKGTRIERSHFDTLKYVIVEGELVSLAGFLTYNSKTEEFQVLNPFAITCGQSEKLFEDAITG